MNYISTYCYSDVSLYNGYIEHKFVHVFLTSYNAYITFLRVSDQRDIAARCIEDTSMEWEMCHNIITTIVILKALLSIVLNW